MRQFSIIFSIILTLFFSVQMVFATVKGKIEYSLPIDYTKLSTTELEAKARTYYSKVIYSDSSEITDDMTNALMLYSVLQNIEPDNIEHSLKLAILYDKINNKKYAKSNFSRAISLNPNNPMTYFYYGKYYYKRNEYRKALKYLEKSYKFGYSSNYETLFILGDIYQKIGDLNLAVNYYNEAYKHKQSEELCSRIKLLGGELPDGCMETSEKNNHK